MIKPINGHILIEPIPRESFVYSEQSTFDEVGIVVDCGDENLVPEGTPSPFQSTPQLPWMPPPVTLVKGDKVYFDSWLAAKYPKSQDSKEHYWLIPFSSVKAYEPADAPLSEEHVPEQPPAPLQDNPSH